MISGWIYVVFVKGYQMFSNVLKSYFECSFMRGGAEGAFGAHTKSSIRQNKKCDTKCYIKCDTKCHIKIFLYDQTAIPNITSQQGRRG